MNYDKDLFISYAHADDMPLTQQQRGWVSQFHESLTHALGYCGRKVDIWRDPNLSGNDLYDKEIEERLTKSAILVSVLSPAYVASTYCRKEIEEFYHAAENSGTIRVGNKSRIIKVIKRPLPSEEQLPPFLKENKSEGYKFYRELENGISMELDPAWGNDLAQEYIRQIVRLAGDVAELIDRLHGLTPLSASASSHKPSVYLAQCSRDRTEAREALLFELRSLNYNIFPDSPLPSDEDGVVAEVSSMLSQCSLSIHLVGSSYGLVPDGPNNKSVVVLQNELAARRSLKAGLRRIIWLPDSTVANCQLQQMFIESLGAERDAQRGADLISGGLEELKSAVHATLKELERGERQAARRIRPKNGPQLVYVVCDKIDLEATRELRRSLTDKGFEVETPGFEGTAARVRKANQEMLEQCDAAILFYGAGDAAWKRTVVNELKKSNGYRREKPPLLAFTYVSDPVTADKRDLIEVRPPNLINGLTGFREASIEPLLNALQKV